MDSSLAGLKQIFAKASQVHRPQAHLQHDERMGVGMQPPYDPEKIAENETPESDHASPGTLGTHEPGGHHRHGHRRPLNQIDHARALCEKRRNKAALL